MQQSMLVQKTFSSSPHPNPITWFENEIIFFPIQTFDLKFSKSQQKQEQDSFRSGSESG